MAPVLSDEQLESIYLAQQPSTTAPIGSSVLSDAQIESIFNAQQSAGTPNVSARQAVLGPITTLGNALTFNAFDDIVAGANASLDYLSGKDAGESYRNTLGELQGYQQDLAKRSPIASGLLGIGGALKLPFKSKVGEKTGIISKVGQAAKEGAVIGGAYGAGKGDLAAALPGVGSSLGYSPEEQQTARKGILSTALSEGKTGAAFAGGLQALGSAGSKVFSGVAKGVDKAARAAKVRGFGVTKHKMAQQLKKSGHELGEEFSDLADDAIDTLTTNNATNPYNEAIDDFRASGGAKVGMSPDKVSKELRRQTKKLGQDLRFELSKAQSQDDAIIPIFSYTDDFVNNSAAGVEKEEARKIALKAISETLNNTDGTILSLQDEKIRLGKVIKDAAWGASEKGAIKEKVYKRIYGDLRRTIEEQYAKATGSDAKIIKDLNKRIGYRSILDPLTKDAKAASEVADLTGQYVQNTRTSGGFGSTMLLSGLSGAAGAGIATGSPYALIPIAGGWLLTPQGRVVTADALEGLAGKAIKTTASALAKGSDLVSQIPPKVVAKALSDQAEPRATEVVSQSADDSLSPTRNISIESIRDSLQGASRQVASSQEEKKVPDQKVDSTSEPNNLDLIYKNLTKEQQSELGKKELENLLKPQVTAQKENINYTNMLGAIDMNKEAPANSISKAGLELIKQSEGLRLSPYKDAAGILTVGYGHTGKVAKSGEKLSKAKADELLMQDVSKAESAIDQLVEVPLTQNQYDALVSLIYNIGIGAFKKSTLLKKLNSGDAEAAAKEFKRWVFANGTKLKGLESRRTKEAELFLA